MPRNARRNAAVAVSLEADPRLPQSALRSNHCDSVVANIDVGGTRSDDRGKELALDLARGSYRPNVSPHLPGVVKAGLDALSRLTQPGAAKLFPAYLFEVPRVVPPTRDASFYLVRTTPAFGKLSSYHLSQVN